jgi:DNA (cytosine-5)-methyltransferase 1
MMRCVDLFAGCGGLSLGFQNAGFDVVAAYDRWPAAVAIYRENFDHPVFEADLYQDDVVKDIESYRPDIIIGGPPCQDFSIAGARNRGKRANLTIRFAKIIATIKPKWFMMENVYNIERMDVLPEALAIFKEAGYGLTRRVLNASLCGVPQIRRRFILVGHLGDKDDFLGELLDSRLADKQMTVRDYLGDSLGTQYYYMHPRNFKRRGVFSIDEPAVTVRGTNRPIPPSYKRHHADKADISEGVRALTYKERSYLQTFPEEFVFVGSKTDIEQAIGNAVPVKLAEYVAKCINDYAEQ